MTYMKETKKKNPDSLKFGGLSHLGKNVPVELELKSGLLKADEVCRIISTCARSNVSVLKFGDLYVKFGPTPIRGKKDTKVSFESPSENFTAAAPDPIAPEAEISENAKRIDAESLEKDELDLREMQIQESVLTDPLEFEKGLASGDLENDGSDEEA
jgi:hypothetical protein